MKIVIIENPRPLTIEHYNDVANAPLSASLNSGYALSVARLAGWKAVHLDFTGHDGDTALMAAHILAENAHIICFHWVYSWGNERVVSSLMDLLRAETSAPIGCFGLFPTLARRKLWHYAPHLDFILFGEFEETLSELLRTFDGTGSIPARPGVALRHGEGVPRPLISDLANLVIPEDVSANCSYSSLNIAASRGCYGDCSFCFIRGYYGCSRRRVRSAASLARELETRLARRNIDSLYFVDPTFIGQGHKERERVMEIGHLVQGYGLSFGFETRVDSVDESLFRLLAKNGAASVFLGIESGCDAVLKRIGKRISKDQIRRGVRTVQESGMQLSLGFIMFEPDSTLAEVEENYAFLEELGLLTDHELTANVLYHNQIVLYGSAAWERFQRQQRLLLQEHLPFEARYRFRDERVGEVCSAMGVLATEYFKGMDMRRNGAAGEVSCRAIDPGTFHGDEVNDLLKDAFQALCSAAAKMGREQISRLTEGYVRQLRKALCLGS